MAMPSPDFDESGSISFRDINEVITGAKHCIAGKNCDSRCPYWNRKRHCCGGDFRKDLLKWVIYLRNRDRRYCEQRPMTDE